MFKKFLIRSGGKISNIFNRTMITVQYSIIYMIHCLMIYYVLNTT